MTKQEIVKKCKSYNWSIDYLYYIVEDKTSHAKSIVCSAWNILFANEHNQFAGVTIYTTKNNISVEKLPEYASCKNIRGEEFVKVCAKIVNGEYYNLTFQENKKQVFQNRIDVEPKFNSIMKDSFTFYNYEDVIDIIDPVSSAKKVYESNPGIRKILDSIMSDYSISLDNLGIIGSTALGATTTNDFDVILYGDKTELLGYRSILEQYIQTEGKYKVGDLYVPFIYEHEGEEIDLLFNYRFDVPLSYSTPVVIEENIRFDVEVVSEEWSYSQFPILIVKSDELEYENLRLGLLSALFRMVIQKGDNVSGWGSVVKYLFRGEVRHMILCIDPPSQLNNYKQYFTNNYE